MVTEIRQKLEKSNREISIAAPLFLNTDLRPPDAL